MAKKKGITPQFDYDAQTAMAHMGDRKFLIQGKGPDAKLFSYSEAKGSYTEGRGRELIPPPKFMMYKKEFDLQEKKKQYDLLKIETFAKSTQFATLEKELKAEGVIEDTS